MPGTFIHTDLVQQQYRSNDEVLYDCRCKQQTRTRPNLVGQYVDMYISYNTSRASTPGTSLDGNVSTVVYSH